MKNHLKFLEQTHCFWFQCHKIFYELAECCLVYAVVELHVYLIIYYYIGSFFLKQTYQRGNLEINILELWWVLVYYQSTNPVTIIILYMQKNEFQLSDGISQSSRFLHYMLFLKYLILCFGTPFIHFWWIASKHTRKVSEPP